MTPDKEIAVAAALTERDGRIFLARRKPEKKSGGLWELPGGKVESGEDAASALARELKEEFDLEARVEAVPYADSRHQIDGSRYRFLVFRTRWDGQIRASTDHDRWGYFLPEEIPFGNLAPLDGNVLRRWARECPDTGTTKSSGESA